MSDTNLSCVPAAIQFFDNSVTGNLADPITSWYWSFGDGTSSTLSDPKHVYTQSGVYFVSLTVTTSGGCTNNNGSAPIVITAYPSPKANFTTSPSVTPMQSNNPTVDFKNTSTGAIKYFWDFGDGITSTNVDPQHHFGITGVYTITLISTNIYGCTDTFRIRTSGGGDISFPTAFTPNPNGPNGGSYNLFNLDNDVFFPFAAGVDEFRMQIFNRWGELIFETLDIKIGWDGYYRGKLCQQDVYVWKANVKFNDGRSITRAGDVTLLR
ncbi:MAG: PKD domain-containing protein [Bacteroidetes bacterium]|nr:PKD domain-containing protein [Bacteroidota bacterium]